MHHRAGKCAAGQASVPQDGTQEILGFSCMVGPPDVWGFPVKGTFRRMEYGKIGGAKTEIIVSG